MPPLCLTDSEMQIVLDAARPLHPAGRDAFLQELAAELASLPMLGDGAVARVAREIQRRHFDPPLLTVEPHGHRGRP
jgi:hypothetical protein